MLFFGVEARRVFQKLSKVRLSTQLGNLGQVGRVVRALAKQRMTVDAILAVPHVLAGHDVRRQCVLVSQPTELVVAVDREGDEDEREQRRAPNEEHAGLSLGHIPLDAGPRGVDGAAFLASAAETGGGDRQT